MSASATEPDVLSPEAEQFGLAFDRLSPADQQTVARLIDLLLDDRTRVSVECFVMAWRMTLDDLRESVPVLRSTQ